MTRPPVRTGGPGAAGAVHFSLLGPLTARRDGRELPLGPRKQRLVLATLLARPNTPVPVDVLTDAVWPDDPPRTARKNLQVYISAARALLGPGGDGGADRLVHGCGGYLLRIGEGELDTLRFGSLARAGRAAAERGDLPGAARLLREALDLWEGPPLNDLRDSSGVADEADRLEARCLTVYEDWAEAEIELGRAAVAVDGLRDLVERHPLRERLRAAWMNSLHQSGRQAEALAVYDDYRQLMARELGLEPSPAMAALYRSMLGRGREARRPAAPRETPSRMALPAGTGAFTGRREELRDLLDVLGGGEERVVVVSGPGVRVSRRWRSGRPGCSPTRFPTAACTSGCAGRTARRAAGRRSWRSWGGGAGWRKPRRRGRAPKSPRRRTLSRSSRRPGRSGRPGTGRWWSWTTCRTRRPYGGCCPGPGSAPSWSPPGGSCPVSPRCTGSRCPRWRTVRRWSCWGS